MKIIKLFGLCIIILLSMLSVNATTLNETNPFPLVGIAAATYSTGMVVELNQDLNITSIKRGLGDGSTDCDLWNATGDVKGSLLASGTFSGDICTFTTQNIYSRGSKLLITVDKNKYSIRKRSTLILVSDVFDLYFNKVSPLSNGMVFIK